jgi:hypothetical protein
MDSKFTKEQLIKQLKANATKGFIERLSVKLREQDFDLNELIDITFHLINKLLSELRGCLIPPFYMSLSATFKI